MVQPMLARDGRVLVYESTQSAEPTLEPTQTQDMRCSRYEIAVPGLERSHSILCIERPVNGERP